MGTWPIEHGVAHCSLCVEGRSQRKEDLKGRKVSKEGRSQRKEGLKVSKAELRLKSTKIYRNLR